MTEIVEEPEHMGPFKKEEMPALTKREKQEHNDERTIRDETRAAIKSTA